MGIVRTPAEQLEQIIADDKQLGQELETAKEKLEAKDAEYAELKAKFEKVKDFLPLVEELKDITYWRITIRDRKVLDAILLRATQMYRKDFTSVVNSNDDAARRSARLKVDNLVEAMLLFASQPLHWNKIYSAYLSRARSTTRN